MEKSNTSKKLQPEDQEAIRLNKYLAKCGLGSRRTCDEIIKSGKILINSRKVTELGTQIVPGKDTVEYSGKKIVPVHKIEYYAYNKPRNVIVSKNDPEGRPTIYDEFKAQGHQLDYVNYIGRLDYSSEGLLLLSNDGELHHALTHPRFQIKKVYLVKVDRVLSKDDCQKLIDGIESEGQILHAGDVREVKGSGLEESQAGWYEIDLFEGKNRQIRRMIEALNYRVQRLKRIQFGTVRLDKLAPNQVRPLTEREVNGLKNLGYKIQK